MNPTRLRTLGMYALLLGVSAFLLFPFYWVLISSVKTLDGLSMTPPTLLPAEYRTDDLTVEADVVEAEGQEWARVAESPDLLSDSVRAAPGAYYVRLDDGTPTQLTRWMPDSSVATVAERQAVPFGPSRVVELEDGAPRVVAARMVRPSAAGTDEILFATAADAQGQPVTVAGLDVLRNPAYQDLHEIAVRWENYPETLRGPEASFGEASTGFLTFSRNSLFVSLMAVLGQILSSSLVAYAFARLRFKGREVLFVLLLATMMIPGQVTLIPLFSIYKTLGWIDTFLPLIVPHFTAGAFNVFLLRQYMLTIPRELDESAAMDGAGPIRTFWSVILPNCVPVLIVIGLFTFVATWQDLLGPLIYLDNPEYRTVTLGLEYFRSPYVDNRHLLMTGAVLAMLPVAVLFLFFQRYIISGIATTGLKG
ncbi:carbohydrate ABC transporter permease [Rubrivirga sp.]|uniref:carbohydrate ABC transporter permease n=1 Tax=Rubrivirga sp. TaxID=1885344 RepID=UPI003B52AC60